MSTQLIELLYDQMNWEDLYTNVINKYDEIIEDKNTDLMKFEDEILDFGPSASQDEKTDFANDLKSQKINLMKWQKSRKDFSDDYMFVQAKKILEDPEYMTPTTNISRIEEDNGLINLIIDNFEMSHVDKYQLTPRDQKELKQYLDLNLEPIHEHNQNKER